MASKGRLLAKLLVDSSGDVASGSLDNATIADGSITTAKLESSVQNTLSTAVLKTSSTGAATLPVGTTAQRPGSASVGMTRMNSSTGSIEFYDGVNWISTNLIPFINSVSGTIYVATESSLVISLTNATDSIIVRFAENGVTISDVVSSVTANSTTVSVPSAVYSQTAGDSITISILNQDGTPSSNSVNKTVFGLPTGGTITTSGGYRYHTFTSSSTFSSPTGFTTTADVLIVAGGAGAGSTRGGGGGAGGVIDTAMSVASATSYTVTVGAGGTGANYNANTGSSNGANSSVTGLTTAIGGGRGASRQGAHASSSGGSGGGGGSDSSAGSSGTSGQGNAGGSAVSAYGGGGGGAGGVGQDQQGNRAGNGGIGINWKSLGTFRAGGGGGGGNDSGSGGTGGSGGGGNGGGGGGANNNPGSSATANTGGGGGGGGDDSNGGNGGSGIVIIRYQL